MVVPAAELDDRNEVQKVFVLGPCQARELELLARFVEPSGPEPLPGAPQVKKEDRPVERGRVAGNFRQAVYPLFRPRGGEKSVVMSGRFFPSLVRRTGLLLTAPQVFSAGRPKPPPSEDLP